jgi:hypothetical protein
MIVLICSTVLFLKIIDETVCEIRENSDDFSSMDLILSISIMYLK